MKLYLTSSIGGNFIENETRKACALDGSNHFLELLSKDWTGEVKCLILSSAPEEYQINESYRRLFLEAFNLSNLPLTIIDVCDARNEDRIADILYDYNVIILAGGHVPTQNAFFNKIHLKELMKKYEGIVIGISAGSMNCADIVYAQPELEGEAIDSLYERYLQGLDLTKLSILPHFQYIKDICVDELRVLEDISLPDSKTRPFYALVDGAFILVENGQTFLYGEAYWVQDGMISKVCDNDQVMQIL
ncbi:MAG: Type 1 glutamine amidotransferase-like domain-containing protein [Mobilitalea sp.]